MAKVYTKEVWVDEVLTEDARYNTLTDAGVPIETEIQIALATSVAVAGTDVDAAKMNNLEDGVDAIDTIVSRIRSLMTQATAAGTTTLTVASDRKQEFTGTTTETVVMPVVSTLVLGDKFTIINNSTGILTVNSSGGNLIASVAAGTVVDLVCVLITGTGAASWDVNSGAVKATGAELDTGTDDSKFATAKAIKDSLNVPSVAPGADGEVMTVANGLWTSAAGASGGGDKYPMEARLTLETGVAISTTDQTAKTTLYLTKYKGDQIAVYDGSSAWSTIALGADISITLAGLTAALPYDVFVYSNAGTLTLELTAWTNITTRATALTTQNGVYVKTGATTRRYLGTICIKATGQCEDSVTSRFVWNYYNRAPRQLIKSQSTSDWTYNTATWRQANGAAANKVEVIVGVAEDAIDLTIVCGVKIEAPNVGFQGCVAIGINATNAPSGLYIEGSNPYESVSMGIVRSIPAVGYSYYAWLEWARGSTTTFFANFNSAAQQSLAGITGFVKG